jgi:hypothetical protein
MVFDQAVPSTLAECTCTDCKENGIKMLLAYWLRHYATNRKVASSIPDEVIFLIYLILPAALGSGVYSASNRNEYQKHKNNNVSGE